MTWIDGQCNNGSHPELFNGTQYYLWYRECHRTFINFNAKYERSV